MVWSLVMVMLMVKGKEKETVRSRQVAICDREREHITDCVQQLFICAHEAH